MKPLFDPAVIKRIAAMSPEDQKKVVEVSAKLIALKLAERQNSAPRDKEKK